ncbi:MAG: phage tail protein [Candidatus Promineifilaceae bacterium]
MSEPFLAEIRMVGFNFAPRGWALCDGQLLPINQNQSLFSLLGTSYGGDGRSTFALPDLRGRTPVHEGHGFPLGSRGGEETHTLAINEMPAHIHNFRVSTDAFTTRDLPGMVLATSGQPTYVDDSPSITTTFKADMVGLTGSGNSHENMQPFLVINYCIALQGIFPPRT